MSFQELECLVTTTDVFLCAPTGNTGAQTLASTHFHAKKVFALGSSLPIGEMKESQNTAHFSQHCMLFAASASCLPTTRPGQRLEWESQLANVLARSRGLDQGQFRRSFRTSQSRSCDRRLANVDKKLMSDSVVFLLAASLPKLGPLPLEASLRKANSLGSIYHQRNDLSPSPSLSPSLPIYLSRSPSIPRPLPVSLSLTHTFCPYTLPFTLRHISASAWLRSHSVLFCFFSDASWHRLDTTQTLAWKSNGKRNGVL